MSTSIWPKVAMITMIVIAGCYVYTHLPSTQKPPTVVVPPVVHVDPREAYLLQMRDMRGMPQDNHALDPSFLKLGNRVCASLASGYTMQQLQRRAVNSKNPQVKTLLLQTLSAAPGTLCQT
jgi:hypothetical protein